MKTVYQYTPEGEYIGEAIAYEDPMRPDRYALPANVTETPPPKVKSGKVAVWVKEEGDGKWKVKEDHRGEVVYHIKTKEKIVVGYIGEIKAEHTDQVPDQWDEWDEIKKKWKQKTLSGIELIEFLQEKYNEIDGETKGKIDEGFYFDGEFFSMSLEAQANWNNLFTLWHSELFPPDGKMISTKNNLDYMLTKEKASKFFDTAETHKNTALAAGRKKKRELRESYIPNNGL